MSQRFVHPVHFTSAYALLGFRSGNPLIDAAVGGLRSDSIVFLKGASIPLLAAERYGVRAQLPEFAGGLGGKTFFVDGGNSFDVYLFTRIAREYELDLDEALSGMIISRAFTPYELQQLIVRDSKEALGAHRPKLLVVLDIFGLFTQDIDADEARKIAGRIRNAIHRINRMLQIPVVITARNGVEHLEPIIDELCTIKVEFEEEDNRVKARVSKHPSNQTAEIVQGLGAFPGNQVALLP